MRRCRRASHRASRRLFSPSGLIYRYVLQSSDRSPQELKTIEDWVLERHYRAVQGVADDSGFGGTTMQYQVLLDPNKLLPYGVSVAQVVQQLGNNNSNAGGGFYSQGGQFYYIRGLGLVRDTADIGNIVVAVHNGIPVYVHDIAQVEIGHAVRLGQFGYMHQDDAVEGVILMRVGEQAQVVLDRLEKVTDDLNQHVLPPDVKVVPYYDRHDLIEETTRTVERNLLRGMALVLVILGLMLFSVRTALIVAATIPFALLFSFICLDWRHIPANLLSIGAIDFGIIVDGAVVMVENIFRELAARHGRALQRDRCDPRGGARCGTAHLLRGRRDHRGIPADLRADRSVGTALPAHGRHHVVRAGRLAALRSDTAAGAVRLFPAKARARTQDAASTIASAGIYGTMLGWCLRNRVVTVLLCLAVFGASLLLIPSIGGEFMPHLDEGALWVRATTPYTISFDEAIQAFAADSQHPAELPPGNDGGQRTGTSRRRHGPDRILQQRILRRPETLRRRSPGAAAFTTSRS